MTAHDPGAKGCIIDGKHRHRAGLGNGCEKIQRHRFTPGTIGFKRQHQHRIIRRQFADQLINGLWRFPFQNANRHWPVPTGHYGSGARGVYLVSGTGPAQYQKFLRIRSQRQHLPERGINDCISGRFNHHSILAKILRRLQCLIRQNADQGNIPQIQALAQEGIGAGQCSNNQTDIVLVNTELQLSGKTGESLF